MVDYRWRAAQTIDLLHTIQPLTMRDKGFDLLACHGSSFSRDFALSIG